MSTAGGVKPPHSSTTFGIYKGHKLTRYGEHVWGEFKGKNIDIYTDTKDRAKLFYVADSVRKWIESKLIYFTLDGKKKITRSKAYD